MPINNQNGSQADSQFQQLITQPETVNQTNRDSSKYEQDMIDLLTDIKDGISSLSQTMLREKRSRGVADYDNIKKGKDKKSSKSSNFSDMLLDEFKSQFGIDDLGNQFKNALKESLTGLTDGIDGDIGQLKKNLSKELVSSIKNSKLGSFVDNRISTASKNFQAELGKLNGKTAEKAAGEAAVKGGTALAEGSLTGLMNVVKAGFKTLLPELIILEVVTDLLEKIGSIVMAFFGGLSEAANRDETTRKKQLEKGAERFKADIESIVKTPFTILEDAANKVYEVWDNTLRQVNQTQGYTKAEFQSLYGAYAERLRSEGLQDAIASSSVVENLNKTIESGMTGKVAEEFAYIATKLNAAIPTQDFFAYSDTYASYVANAIKDGMSQSDAIAYANKQLENFASDLVYAGRELSGGFTTGLKDSSNLFKQANEIALAARTGNAANIGGTLTSISAIVGAIAPDLASNVVSAVYDAAVGGNDSNIVALRTLAGVNASNTEFLKEFANNPQKIFETLFRNLAGYQNMSDSNYMEVADNLPSIFGLDRSAFQRVDFSYLADAISNMNMNNKSLEENLDLLASGQSTLTSEQLRNRQINEYMINEGLAYVLDNEVARAIQQHMWDEQIALEMQEAEYSVNLTGTALTALSDLVGLVRTVAEFLNPIAWISKSVNLIQTSLEVIESNAKIVEVLEAGKVGNGNLTSLMQLVTRADMIAANPLKASGLGQMLGWGARLTGGNATGLLGLSKDYISQLKESNKLNRQASKYNWGQVTKSQLQSLGLNQVNTSYSSYSSNSTNNESQKNVDINKLDRLYSTITTGANAMENYFGSTQKAKMDEAIEKETQRQIRVQRASLASNYKISQYAIELQSKYGMNQAQAIQRAEQELTALADSTARAAAESSIDKSKYESGYQVWYENASKIVSRQGENIEEMLENLNISQSDLQAYFSQADAQSSSQSSYNRTKDEEEFWANTQSYLKDLVIINQDTLIGTHLSTIIEPWMDQYMVQFKEYRGDFNSFYNAWKDYYISHTTYNEHLGANLVEQWEAVNRSANKSQEDKFNSLVELLTKTDIADLMDPTVQQTVLLGYILQALQTIVQQNNTQGKLSLPDSIRAMASGMMNQD